MDAVRPDHHGVGQDRERPVRYQDPDGSAESEERQAERQGSQEAPHAAMLAEGRGAAKVEVVRGVRVRS